MTDPNVLLGNDGMKFIFASGDTQMIHLMRPKDGSNFSNAILSLCTANAGVGTTYQVPVGKSFYMLNFMAMNNSTGDIKCVIQKNTVADTDSTTTGDDIWNFTVEGSSENKGYLSINCGGIKFDAGDYVTPYDLDGAGANKWSFSCYGVECDA